MSDVINIVLTVADAAGATAVTLHVLANRTDVRAAAGWIALAWLSPFAGSIFYVLFGINRIARRAFRLRRSHGSHPIRSPDAGPHISVDAPHLEPLSLLTWRVSGLRLTAGNRLDILFNGDMAYPAMLHAIDHSVESVILSSYIFRADEAGLPLIDALVRAHQRGVAVRVLVDGIGAGYFQSPVVAVLAKAGVPVARFLHSWLPWRMPFLNLRLHKKILVVDGRTGFTGGVNIGAENLTDASGRIAVQDTHFRISGPVVSDLAASFEQDWAFATGKRHRHQQRGVQSEADGPAFCRGVQSGPDDDVMKIESSMIGAVNAARTHVRVVTPYFLPDRTLQMALVFAALRGVSVEIVIPRESDHPIVDWSNRAHIGTLLKSGCRVFLSPKPLDHSKIMTIDGAWSLVGSANWDVRSLRLNFEFDLEVWDSEFARELGAAIDRKLAASERLSIKELKAASPLVRIRNSAARLLLPYL